MWALPLPTFAIQSFAYFPTSGCIYFYNALIRRNNHRPILQMKTCVYQLWIASHKTHITQGKWENGPVTERRRNVKYLAISLTEAVIFGGIWNLWRPKVWYIIFHHMKTNRGKQDENKISTVKWNKNPFMEGGFCPDTRPSGFHDYSLFKAVCCRAPDWCKTEGKSCFSS